MDTNCPLCKLWDKLPYKSKYTTPTTAKETEGALSLGLYLGKRLDYTTVCKHHSELTEETFKLFLSECQKEPVPPPPPPTIETFELGLEPLKNENTAMAQLPTTGNVIDLAPYQVKPGSPEGALEAAKAAPVEGANVSMNCPLCGEMILTGQVHMC